MGLRNEDRLEAGLKQRLSSLESRLQAVLPAGWSGRTKTGSSRDSSEEDAFVAKRAGGRQRYFGASNFRAVPIVEIDSGHSGMIPEAWA